MTDALEAYMQFEKQQTPLGDAQYQRETALIAFGALLVLNPSGPLIDALEGRLWPHNLSFKMHEPEGKR